MAESLELAVAGVANDARTDRFKAGLIESLQGGLIADGPVDAEKGFAFLVQTIRKDPVPARKVAAAKSLVAFPWLSTQQRATIEGLRRENLGEEVTKELKNALERK